MPFKVLNSRTVISCWRKSPFRRKFKLSFFKLFLSFILNKAWKDIPKNKVEKIYELLDINANSSLRFSENIIFLSPRNGSQSPWSSKTEDIFTSCNLNEIQRIERIKGLETEGFSEKLLKKENFPFDYLTEEFSIGLKSIESFFTKPNKNSFSFKYLKNTYQSYIDANQKFGFGLNDQEINYLVNSYKSLKRNPTDVELMMFSQANSEHCRHKFFNALGRIYLKKMNQVYFNK
jgi:phosphoribosylformylglycinamidine synthase